MLCNKQYQSSVSYKNQNGNFSLTGLWSALVTLFQTLSQVPLCAMYLSYKTFWPCYTFPLFLLSLFYYSVGKCNSHIYINDIFIKAGKRISFLAIIYGIIVFFYILNNRSSVFYEYFVFHILCIFSIVKWLYFFMKEDK